MNALLSTDYFTLAKFQITGMLTFGKQITCQVQFRLQVLWSRMEFHNSYRGLWDKNKAIFMNRQEETNNS